MCKQFSEWLTSTLFPRADHSVTAEHQLLGGQKRVAPAKKNPMPVRKGDPGGKEEA